MKKQTIKRIDTVVQENLMTSDKWTTLWESVKEPLRLFVLGIISFLITELTSLEDQQMWITVLTIVLRFFDKWLHEFGKREGKEELVKGITRF